jgi:calcineurin-like phosphoesterase family protein
MAPKFFFTADTHFHHRRILEFASNTRPVESLDQMHETLIFNWNCQVKPLDHVYHLGDFSFGSPQQAAEILSQLNGSIHLIKGNHDHWLNPYTKSFLASVSDYKIFKRGDHRAVLFHYPIAEWDRMQHGSFHLYGHVHGSLQLPGKALDVGIDNRPNSDMKLWEWEEIISYMADHPVLNHHTKCTITRNPTPTTF